VKTELSISYSFLAALIPSGEEAVQAMQELGLRFGRGLYKGIRQPSRGNRRKHRRALKRAKR
jgi:hypothetical protein